ncbi:MAG: hypothetical protein V1887_02310 [Candidatus Aenigmatarchaeota archaeon]
MKLALGRKRAVIAILIVAVLGAVAYQSMQPGQENPVVTLCEQQFRQGNAGNYSGFFACITESAVAQLDPGICGTRMDTWMQSDCIKAVIAAAPEDPAVYEKLRNPYLRGMLQYQKGNLSSDESNPDFGIEIYFLDIVRNETNIPINTSEKHMFICEEIDNVYPRSQCYMAIAWATNNTSVCERVQIDSYKDGCYWNIVNKIPDPTICGNIVDILTRTDCYSYIASMTKDASICEKIEIPERKNICYQSVSEMKTGVKT